VVSQSKWTDVGRLSDLNFLGFLDHLKASVFVIGIVFLSNFRLPESYYLFLREVLSACMHEVLMVILNFASCRIGE
jgi:hypothetical protein